MQRYDRAGPDFRPYSSGESCPPRLNYRADGADRGRCGCLCVCTGFLKPAAKRPLMACTDCSMQSISCTCGTPQMQLCATSYIRAAYCADCAYCVLETVKFACGESCVQNQVAHRTATTDCSAQHAYSRLSFVCCSSRSSQTTLSAHGLASLRWLWRLARPKPRVSAMR